jgi:hypothetical protein
MVSPRYKNVFLHVKAVDEADVREIDELGRPLQNLRVVGKENHVVIKEGVFVPYHSHYIARLKEKNSSGQSPLLPADLETAQLAGVNWNPDLLK